MRPLQVLANLCSIVPGCVGGSEEYATRLLEAVIALLSPPLVKSVKAGSQAASERAASAISAEDAASRTVQLELAAMAGVRSAHPELAGPVWHETRRSGHNRLRRLAVESTWLARRSASFDVVHHFGGRIPAVRRGAAVVSIHDLQPLEMPENFSAVKRRYLHMALKRTADASDVMVAVPSKWVAERVVELLGVTHDRLCVVPSTYPSGFTQGISASPAGRQESQSSTSGASQGGVGDSDRLEEPQRVGEGVPGPEPFVLYPAAAYPHKNHGLLIAAHAAMRTRNRDVKLVLTGGGGRARVEVARLVAGTPGVVHLGRVDEARLASLFSAAAAVAFPSRYEGFGLPVLEAMAVGTPVVAANATALPEMLRGAGLLVGPDDLDGWVDALTETLGGSSAVRRRVELGRVRARRYAPEKVAARLLTAWRSAAVRVE